MPSSERTPLDARFLDQLNRYPVRFTVPVFFGESPQASLTAALNNGTATLLRLKDRYVAVTCQHVLAGFRAVRDIRRHFQVGPVPLDPDRHLISEDTNRDLAVLDLTPYVDAEPELAEKRFITPISWPPAAVSTEDVLCLAGFPGVWREQLDLGHLRFYSYSSGAAEVVEARPDLIVSTVRLDDCIVEINHGKVVGSLGGLSGGPVFAWRKTPILLAELVGFIYEYSEGLDLMFIRPASAILEDGRIVPE